MTLPLRGERVVVRALRPPELDARVEIHLRAGSPPGQRRTRASLRRRWQRSGRWADGRIDLVVEADGRPVGTIQAWRGWGNGFPPGVAEIGMTVDDAADRGRGFGREAVSLFASWLLENGVERVQASTEVGNVAARAALEKAGFTFEGVLRGYFPADGRGRADYAMYSILAGSP